MGVLLCKSDWFIGYAMREIYIASGVLMVYRWLHLGDCNTWETARELLTL